MESYGEVIFGMGVPKQDAEGDRQRQKQIPPLRYGMTNRGGKLRAVLISFDYRGPSHTAQDDGIR